MFGKTANGILGLSPSLINGKTFIANPTAVEELTGKSIVSLALGLNHSLALCESGDLYSWGNNEDGALGRPTTESVDWKPQLVEEFREFFEMIVCGDDHVIAKACKLSVFNTIYFS